ncbi:cytochrome b/b6 domain-containing protein [Marinobacter sp. MMG032]|uniref:Cytochrome b/b6 domain-containing protein n=1 Tax=Marinobacter sp. MMG032 TaxID=3158548 RepID=A0AAU7MS04_9GAMM
MIGFSEAARLHTLAAWSLIILWLFAIFWHVTTGEWRQYIPTRNKLFAVIRYYLIGTFTGEPHPYRKTTRAKHNLLQRLAYLFFKLMITPVIWLSGLLYLFYNDWPATLSNALELETVALVHTAAAFAMLVFIIAHVYMATMGPRLTSLIKPMITGYEDLEEHH